MKKYFNTWKSSRHGEKNVACVECHYPPGTKRTVKAKFKGEVEHVVNFFNAVAHETREIMASLGARKLTDLIGRPDLIDEVAYPLGLDPDDEAGDDDVVVLNQLYLPIKKRALIHLTSTDVI